MKIKNKITKIPLLNRTYVLFSSYFMYTAHTENKSNFKRFRRLFWEELKHNCFRLTEPTLKPKVLSHQCCKFLPTGFFFFFLNCFLKWWQPEQTISEYVNKKVIKFVNKWPPAFLRGPCQEKLKMTKIRWDFLTRTTDFSIKTQMVISSKYLFAVSECQCIPRGSKLAQN